MHVLVASLPTRLLEERVASESEPYTTDAWPIVHRYQLNTLFEKTIYLSSPECPAAVTTPACPRGACG